MGRIWDNRLESLKTRYAVIVCGDVAETGFPQHFVSAGNADADILGIMRVGTDRDDFTAAGAVQLQNIERRERVAAAVPKTGDVQSNAAAVLNQILEDLSELSLIRVE